MFNFIFILFINLFSATFAESKCFKLTDDNISLSGNNLTIKGNGTMCDCHFDELEHYRKTVQTIHFEQSVTTIGKKCFEQFTSLTSIEVDPENPFFKSVDGVLFDYLMTKLIQYPSGK